MKIAEIRKLPATAFRGGKQELYPQPSIPSKYKKLPEFPNFLYSIDNTKDGKQIRIWDSTKSGNIGDLEGGKTLKYKLVGELIVDKPESFPLKKAIQVYTITIDEDYRGMGISKLFYKIVLEILGYVLLAGKEQTPQGRQLWVSLASTPGVDVKGYMRIKDYDLITWNMNDVPSWDRQYAKRDNLRTEKIIDTVMNMGGQYIGYADSPRFGRGQYFAFDVSPNTTNKELKAYVDQKMVKVYSDSKQDIETGLYAIWNG